MNREQLRIQAESLNETLNDILTIQEKTIFRVLMEQESEAPPMRSGRQTCGCGNLSRAWAGYRMPNPVYCSQCGEALPKEGK